MAQNGIFSVVWFFGFLSITPFKTIKLQKLGVFWKIQEICNNMGTRICKIIEEMSEIIEPKVGNPKNSVSRNWAIVQMRLRTRTKITAVLRRLGSDKSRSSPGRRRIFIILYFDIMTFYYTVDIFLCVPNVLWPDWRHCTLNTCYWFPLSLDNLLPFYAFHGI